MPEVIKSFFNNNEKISAILHEPSQRPYINKKIIIIFLHGGAGHRTGPHRMFVKLARGLTNKGFYCCRFDFRCRGFSDGSHENITNKSMLSDLEVVISSLKNIYKAECFVLLGICSGAKLAIYYAINGTRKIDHVIALSSPLLTSSDNINKEIKQTKTNIKEYIKKIAYINTWEKCTSGRFHYDPILKNILSPLKNIAFYIKKFFLSSFRSSGSSLITEQKSNNNTYNSFRNFNGNILLIHGENDPYSELSINQIIKLCNKCNIECDLYVISGGGHSFYSIKWENEIFYVIEKWLTEKYETIINYNFKNIEEKIQP